MQPQDFPDSLSGIRKVSTPIQIANEIRLAIQSGRLKPGSRLPNEKDLAASFGVGRSTLREGIKLLSAYGVLDVRQGGGTFVCQPLAAHPYEQLGFIPVRENMLHLQAFRRVLECGVLQQLEGKVSDADCDELEALTQKLQSDNPARDIEALRDADMRFHQKLIALSGNPLIVRVYEMTRNMLSSLMDDLLLHPDVLRDAHASHSAIVTGLRQNNNADALRGMQGHLDNIDRYVEAYIEE